MNYNDSRSVGKRERERETERDRQTDTETDRQTDTKTDSQRQRKDRDNYREIDRKTVSRADIYRQRPKEKLQTDGQTETRIVRELDIVLTVSGITLRCRFDTVLCLYPTATLRSIFS